MIGTEGEAPTVGLLVCKNKDNVLTQYAVNSSNAPVGISEYELSDLMPDYSEVVIETSNLIMKKAVFDDWEQLYRNITSRPESAKYMLWKIDDSEEESKDRMPAVLSLTISLRRKQIREREKNTWW